MGAVAIGLIRALAWLENLFERLPVRRPLIWAPVVGALILGAIGYFYPQVLGTSYGTIRDMLNDRLTAEKLIGISVAKFWALVISLGSGTTGGVFAPSLVIGGGIGAVYGMFWQHFFPRFVSDPALYSLVAMGAVFGGAARAPFTSIAFLFELSHNPDSLLPLIVCVMVSDGFVRLLSRDSIMTEKLTRRGFIVLQDYSVPVLMRSRIDQVMHKQFHTVQADADLGAVLRDLTPAHMGLLPVVEQDGSLIGIVEAEDLLRVAPPEHHFKMRELARQDYVLAYPGELIDRVSRDMLSKNVENIIIVEPNHASKPVGVARANDILQLRRWLMDEESRSEAAAVGGKQPGSVT